MSTTGVYEMDMKCGGCDAEDSGIASTSHKIKRDGKIKKLKGKWKVIFTGLCTIALLLECTNVILSSKCKRDSLKIRTHTELDASSSNDSLSNMGESITTTEDLCSERKEFKLRVGRKRVNVCTYNGHVRVDVREFLDSTPTVKGVYFTNEEYIALEEVLPYVRREMMRQTKIMKNN